MLDFVYSSSVNISLMSLCYKSIDNVSSTLKLNAPAEPTETPQNTMPSRTYQNDRLLAPKPINDEDILNMFPSQWILITGS